MSNETRRRILAARIASYGERLLEIFPEATVRDPVKLCKRLRRLEAEGHAFGLRLCNGPPFAGPEAEDAVHEDILRRAYLLLGKVGPVIILDRDPRGHALKVDSSEMRGLDSRDLDLLRNMGGDGIIAPDLR